MIIMIIVVQIKMGGGWINRCARCEGWYCQQQTDGGREGGPAKVKERVEEKTRKKAEIVSVHPKKEAAAAGGGGDKKPDEKKADEKKAEDKKPKEVRKTHPPTITRGGATKMGPPLEHSKFC